MSHPTKSDSTIGIKMSERGPNEVLLVQNAEKAIITRHTTLCAWEQLIRSVEVARDEIQKEFVEYLDGVRLPNTVAFEPFNLTMSFWRKDRMLVKKNTSVNPSFENHIADTSATILQKLPKMAWSLRKTYVRGKSDTLVIAFEWLETVKSAPAKDVIDMLIKERRV